MLGLFKSLLGGKQEVTISDDPFGRDPKPAALVLAPIAAAASPNRRVAGVSVHRDEIIGNGSRIVGYRFRAVRQTGGNPPAAGDSVAALKTDNLLNFAQRRLALVPITLEDWRDAGFEELIAPQTTFLVQSDDLSAGASVWLETLTKIKGQGGQVAVNALTISTYPLLQDVVDLVVIDFHDYSLEGFESQVKAFLNRDPQPAIAADGINSWAEHRLCQGLGVRYSLGGFAAMQDDQVRGEKLNQSRLVMIEMLNLLRSEANTDALAAVAKRDPGVAVKIVDMANSPLSGLSAPVASLQQAMLVLGRSTLYRWISLGIYRAGTDGRDETLLEIALHRARFLELAGAGIRSKQECDELFLVGLLSLLDSLLGMAMDRAVERMNLPEVVRSVLLNSDGPYGRFLLLALAAEKGNPETLARLAEQIGISLDRVEECRVEAECWTDAALQTDS
jgi:EAL and modified HD-GYP domain-containing signal transduction protein